MGYGLNLYLCPQINTNLMNYYYLKNILGVIIFLLFAVTPVQAADDAYKETKEYLSLRDSMHRAFNDADSTRFFRSVKALQNYLLQQEDLHAYYTQRCNEIVFQLNRERIFEAYKLATQLSKELTERKLDKEMYMAINMMGHIYRYCGNKESAKRCFWEVIHRMEKEGYTESMPPIYMNLVNIYMEEDPPQALQLIDKAAEIAGKTSPERVFDIETRRSLAYYVLGDIPRFLQGYKAYKEGEAKGMSSVHGHTMEIYYLASQGRTDEAVSMAAQSAENPFETQADILSKAGRWEEAYKSLQKGAAESDSINSVILSYSMQDIQNELSLYDMKREASRRWFYALAAIVCLLLLLVGALFYIVYSRRRHLREMKKAYKKVLASDQMKTSFIQNVSHEVRTPLNIISGFAQVIAKPDLKISTEERHRIAENIVRNTRLITVMVDEVLDMSNVDAIETDHQPQLPANKALQKIVRDFRRELSLDESQLSFETTLNDDFCVSIHDHLLARIVYPLLDNAAKNRGDGPVHVKISQDDSRLLVTVEDHGPGVPASEAEHIFERFVKLDTFKQGLGLGLTFSREMARRLGGDVWLDTTYAGPGACFKLRV